MTPVAPVVDVHCGDALAVLSQMPAESVHCVVTSPPYWQMRDYGVPGQIGLEAELGEYLDKLVAVFQQVRRVLRPDGVAWVNMGDCYATTPPGCGSDGVSKSSTLHGVISEQYRDTLRKSVGQKRNTICGGLKPKDMVGQPWRLAFALQADGWYLRQDIIWHKPNPMPESIQDRCTKAHEYVFLLSKSERYWYDSEAIKEPQSQGTHERFGKNPQRSSKRKLEVPGVGTKNNTSFDAAMVDTILPDGKRNRRSVWTVASQPYRGAHFATFPEDLVRPMILAGCPVKCCPKCGAGWERVIEDTPEYERFKASERDRKGQGMRGGNDLKAYGLSRGTSNKSVSKSCIDLGFKPSCRCNCDETVPGTVLDPFGGSGTVGKVAVETGRNAVLIELNPEYVKLIHERCRVTPGLPL